MKIEIFRCLSSTLRTKYKYTIILNKIILNKNTSF